MTVADGFLPTKWSGQARILDEVALPPEIPQDIW